MIVDIEKQPTWTDKVTELEVGEHFYAPYKKRLTIAPLISKLKKDIDYHKRQFETERVVIDFQELTKVTRLEDKEDL